MNVTRHEPRASFLFRQRSRKLFASMGFKPALLETEALLGSADAAAL
jgi:hypothetical protein